MTFYDDSLATNFAVLYIISFVFVDLNIYLDYGVVDVLRMV